MAASTLAGLIHALAPLLALQIAPLSTDELMQRRAYGDVVAQLALPADAKPFDAAHQRLAWQYAFLGRADLAGAVPAARPLAWCGDLTLGATARDPVAAVLDAVKSHRVVVINESHIRPETRLLTRALLPRLRALGFTHFAAEAFWADTLVSDRALRDHIYAGEPVFASMVRDARALGYELVRYDETGSWKVREEKAAANLAAVLATMTPDQRLLVHVGHGHVNKLQPNEPNDAPSVTGRLQQQGFDPLAINTTCAAPGAAGSVGQIFFDPQGVMRIDPAFRDRVDLFVHATGPWDGTVPPADLARAALGKARAIPTALLANELRVVEARRPGESDEIAPHDRILLRPGENLPLHLPAGRWVLQSLAHDGTIAARATIEARD
ncbi:hypothetical protein [Roseiterribacter gracilis]|uniref:Uncharacterized protein n=1 Tax=Roseiterribacter gracilis TaxID=2812848 RepID=A0A8S8XGD9_9PROT|nr:hypothetical protein TMPK1_32690 [Rhodospirillales bacterium TMPK1]